MMQSSGDESKVDGSVPAAVAGSESGRKQGDPTDQRSASHGVGAMAGEDKFEPDITAFTCIYCGAMAGDSAGAERVTYPANVKMIRLPCTGKVDSEYILKAFEQGADGVYVMACPIGNCHHERGNVRATKRVEYVKKLLDEIGIGRERLAIYYVSGGQGHAFAHAARQMTAHIRRIGPSPVKRSRSPDIFSK